MELCSSEKDIERICNLQAPVNLSSDMTDNITMTTSNQLTSDKVDDNPNSSPTTTSIVPENTSIYKSNVSPYPASSTIPPPSLSPPIGPYTSANINIAVMPYPGCEFFREFKDNNYNCENLYFDWMDPAANCTSELSVRCALDCAMSSSTPSLASITNHSSSTVSTAYANQSSSTTSNNNHDSRPPPLPSLIHNIDWSIYKSWSLVDLTKNYLHLLLTLIKDTSSTSGVLIHCISGWDRTPAFISLLRLSLWADDDTHCSLTPDEILYLTIAYVMLCYINPLCLCVLKLDICLKNICHYIHVMLGTIGCYSVIILATGMPKVKIFSFFVFIFYNILKGWNFRFMVIWMWWKEGR